jgi:hypothetical protein
VYKKLLSIFTCACFLFSFVFATAAEGAVEILQYARLAGQLQSSISAPGYELDIPLSMGRITSLRDFNTRQLVINIQDLHFHTEVQRNIAKILGVLDKKYKLSQVFVEGGYGDIDTSWLNGIKDAAAKREVIEDLVNQGRLTGAEYYSMATKRYNLLKGLEDEQLHKGNIVRLGKILEKQPEFKRKLKETSRDLELMKAKYFNGGNIRFNRILAKHKTGEMESSQYYNILNKYINKITAHPRDFNNLLTLNINNYPNIKTHFELIEMQKRFHYKQVAKQAQSCMQALKSQLPYNVYSRMVEKTDNLTNLDVLY